MYHSYRLPSDSAAWTLEDPEVRIVVAALVGLVEIDPHLRAVVSHVARLIDPAPERILRSLDAVVMLSLSVDGRAVVVAAVQQCPAFHSVYSLLISSSCALIAPSSAAIATLIFGSSRRSILTASF